MGLRLVYHQMAERIGGIYHSCFLALGNLADSSAKAGFKGLGTAPRKLMEEMR
jgi:hypothetical protein